VKNRIAISSRKFGGILKSRCFSKAAFFAAYNPSFAIPPNDGDYRAPPMDIIFLNRMLKNASKSLATDEHR
jgi:hypothetical protein